MDIAFHRTSSGLSNLSIFLGVDVVVYLEGGDRKLSLADLETDLVASENHDTMFWQTILNEFRPNIKAHLKSIGSKATVISVSRLVVTGVIHHVITALDRDFDHIRRAKIRHPNVLYTYGYSWENDVFTKSNLKTLSRSLCLNRIRCKKINDLTDDLFEQFLRSFKVQVQWDNALAGSCADLCDRGALMNSIELRPPSAPRISRKRVATLLRESHSNNRNVRLKAMKRIDVQRDLHGHTVERFASGVLQHILAEYLGTKANKDLCMRLLIGIFEKSLKGKSAMASHYRTAATSIVTGGQVSILRPPKAQKLRPTHVTPAEPPKVRRSS